MGVSSCKRSDPHFILKSEATRFGYQYFCGSAHRSQRSPTLPTAAAGSRSISRRRRATSRRIFCSKRRASVSTGKPLRFFPPYSSRHSARKIPCQRYTLISHSSQALTPVKMAENRPPNRPPNFQWSTSSKSTRPPNFSWWALAFCSVGRTLSGRDLLVRYTVHGRTCTLNCWGVVQPVGHRTVNADGEGSNPSAPAKIFRRLRGSELGGGQTGGVPAAPTAVHRFHIRIAHLLQIFRGKRGAKSAPAIENELRF